jgi:hypothetical protein
VNNLAEVSFPRTGGGRQKSATMSSQNTCEESMEWSYITNNKRKSTDTNEDIAFKKSSTNGQSEAQQTKISAVDTRKSKGIVPPLIKYFQTNNKGPFNVWIQPKVNENGKPILFQVSPFKVGNLICKNYKSIDYICSKSKARVEISFKNVNEANQVLDDPVLDHHDLKAFIPSFRLMRRGIIKGIDEDISEEEILKELEAENQIVGVRRLSRRNRDPNRQENDPKWVTSKSVVITFSGQNLPNEASIYKIKLEVEPYMTLPITCYNCFKLGHTSTNCRNEARCSMCGEIKHQENCATSSPICSNCRGDHFSSDKGCPVYQKEYEVKRLMAYENLAMGDARKLVYPKKKFKPSQKEFPSLQNKHISSYNEITKNRKSLVPIPRRVEGNKTSKKAEVERPVNFYKMQQEKCEDFFGNRELNSTNGIAIGQENKGSKNTQDIIMDRTKEINNIPEFEESTAVINKIRSQRVTLKEISINTSYGNKKKDSASDNHHTTNSQKPMKDYSKVTKVKENNNKIK